MLIVFFIVGAVFVYTLTDGAWTYQSMIVAHNAVYDDQFGVSVAVNHESNRLFVGALRVDDASLVDNGSSFFKAELLCFILIALFSSRRGLHLPLGF